MEWRFRHWTLVALAALMMACGCLAIARAQQFADIPADAAWRQAKWAGAALVVMLLAAAPSYRLLIRPAYALWGATIVALLAVYLFGPVNGAHRWMRLGGIGFQPSEFAKLAVIVALARYLMYRETASHWSGVAIPLLLALVPLWLVLKEPDLGTSLVFLPVLGGMLYAAGAPRRRLAAMALIGLAAAPMIWNQMSRDQRSRVVAMWQQESAGDSHSAASRSPPAYHLHEAKRMFALGGVWGSYFSPSDDDLGDGLLERRVPEPHTDSVVCVWGERFGIAGCAVLLGFYLLLIWRIMAVAEETHEPFGRLIVVGVAAMIAFQTAVNTAMLVGLAPITGVPLPLMSYGGSELLATALGLGLVLNVASRPGYELGG